MPTEQPKQHAPVTVEDCAALRMRQEAVTDARQLLEDMQTDLAAEILRVRRKYKLPVGSNIDLKTGDVTFPVSDR